MKQKPRTVIEGFDGQFSYRNAVLILMLFLQRDPVVDKGLISCSWLPESDDLQAFDTQTL
jgi:hypothetical protein